ncbi:MAG: replicative DNA helicase [Bacteroidia bacterium]|nr:replicative DNA helicase [Bacteroidia bacterium]
MNDSPLQNRKKDKKKTSYLVPQDNLGRRVPAAVEIEQAVLGALLLDGKALLRIQEILVDDYFYDDRNKAVYNAIFALTKKNEPIDILTVIEKLRETDKLEFVGGEFYVSELTMKVTSSANIEFHAHIILEKYVLRELIQICGETINHAYDAGVDSFSLLDETEKAIYEIKNKGMKRNYESIGNLVSKALTQINENKNHSSSITGVPSGIIGVDNITSGWQKSDLIIIAGRPGMGKTAFALTLLRNAAVGNKTPVAFFSLEMSAVQLVTRMISAESEISSEALRRGNLEEYEWQQLVTKTQALSEAPIFIDDTPSLTVFELKAKARRLHSQHKIGMLMVDYLQLMKGEDQNQSKVSMNREQEIGYISRSLKTLAKELNIPVIALAQLSRETDKRQDKMPQLSDLRESGSIEQDADMVAFIYRDDYYNKGDEDAYNDGGVASKLIIKKYRHGSLGDANMYFSKKLQRFVDESESKIANFILPSKMNENDAIDNSFRDSISNKADIFKSNNDVDDPFLNSNDTDSNFFDN